jgi:hypothetical protein
MRSIGKHWLALGAVAGCVSLAACADTTNPGGTQGPVTLSFTTASSTGAALDRISGDQAVGAANVPTEVTVQSVDLVLARVRLEREHEESECEDAEHDTACAEFRTGPVLVALPLNGSAITPFSMTPAPGTYDRIRFRIHRPEGNDSSTQAFFAANPTWPAGASIHVTGTVTFGTGATAVTSDFDSYLRTEGDVRQAFDPPLVVDDTTDVAALNESMNVQVAVDVNQWFRTESGALIDPRALTTDPRLLSRVERNIAASFRAEHSHGRHGGNDDGNGHGRHDD